MVASSLRNSMARKNHKERAQPLHRQKWGNLEKHKDYVLRARDYKSKQDRIRKLREKASFRNKDEFYYGMIKAKTENGVMIGDRGNEALSVDIVRVLKSQDLGWVRVQISQDEKRVRKLRQELEITIPAEASSSKSEWNAISELEEIEKLAEMGIIVNPTVASTSSKKSKKGKEKDKGGHIVFAEGREEFDAYHESRIESNDAAEVEQKVDLGWEEPNSTVKSKKKDEEKPVPKLTEEEEAELIRQNRIALLTSLSAHLGRLRQLRIAESKLLETKGLMGKGSAKKIKENGWVEDENVKEDRNGEKKRFVARQFKWKLERKK